MARVLRTLPDWVWDGCEPEFSAKDLDAQLLLTSKHDDSSVDIRFSGVVAFRFANEGHVKGIAPDSICKVVEVLNNRWVTELKELSQSQWPFVRRHFAVYVEDIGYYELLAEDMQFQEVRDGEFTQD